MSCANLTLKEFLNIINKIRSILNVKLDDIQFPIEFEDKTHLELMMYLDLDELDTMQKQTVIIKVKEILRLILSGYRVEVLDDMVSEPPYILIRIPLC